MKVRGLIRDVTGASRVTRARRNLIASGSSENHYSDPIRELAEEVHPEVTRVRSEDQWDHHDKTIFHLLCTISGKTERSSVLCLDDPQWKTERRICVKLAV